MSYFPFNILVELNHLSDETIACRSHKLNKGTKAAPLGEVVLTSKSPQCIMLHIPKSNQARASQDGELDGVGWRMILNGVFRAFLLGSQRVPYICSSLPPP